MHNNIKFIINKNKTNLKKLKPKNRTNYLKKMKTSVLTLILLLAPSDAIKLDLRAKSSIMPDPQTTVNVGVQSLKDLDAFAKEHEGVEEEAI